MHLISNSDANRSHDPVIAAIWSTFKNVTVKVWKHFVQWMRARDRQFEKKLQRRDLAHLDSRLLDDIGLTPSDVAREADKPFWQ